METRKEAYALGPCIVASILTYIAGIFLLAPVIQIVSVICIGILIVGIFSDWKKMDKKKPLNILKLVIAGILLIEYAGTLFFTKM